MAIAAWVFEALITPSIQSPGMCALALGLATHLAVRANRMQLARYLIVGSWSAFTLVSPLSLNGVRTPVLINMIWLLLLAGWLLGRRALVMLTILFVVSVSLYWQAEARGWFVMDAPLREPNVWAMVWLSITVFTATVVWFLIKHYQENFELLTQRTLELREIHERERIREFEQGAILERQRLTRDLHDGLGGHLTAVLRMAQRPTVSKDDITVQLRTAVDQLKITVDAMQETDGDIPSLLGAIRYRLARRLDAADIGLKWDVEHLPIMVNWGVRQSYELQMILFEVFTNMMVHSGATQAILNARRAVSANAEMIDIEISDNGKGFNPEHITSDSGRGVANMRKRAAILGAELCIHSQPGFTCINILLQCK